MVAMRYDKFFGHEPRALVRMYLSTSVYKEIILGKTGILRAYNTLVLIIST